MGCIASMPSALRSSVTKPIFRRIACGRALNVSNLPTDLQRTGEKGSLQKGLSQLGPSGALQACNTQNFALAHSRFISFRKSLLPFLILQHNIAKILGVSKRREIVIQITSNHHMHNLLGVVSLVITVPTNSPSLRTVIFSAISNTSIRRCETKMMAIPRALSLLIRSVRIFTSVKSQRGGRLIHDQDL